MQLNWLTLTHLQLRNLRNTIPNLIEPMLEPHSSPEALYATFSHTAMTAAKNMRGFTELMEDPESKALLERARTRRLESKEVILPWRATQHEGWLDYNVASVGKDHKEAMDESMPDKPAPDGADKDPCVILDAFKREHPTVIADMDESAKTIKVYQFSSQTT